MNRASSEWTRLLVQNANLGPANFEQILRNEYSNLYGGAKILVLFIACEINRVTVWFYGI